MLKITEYWFTWMSDIMGSQNFFQLFHVVFLILPHLFFIFFRSISVETDIRFISIMGWKRQKEWTTNEYAHSHTTRNEMKWIERTNGVFCLVHLWHQCAKLVLYDFYSKRYFCSNDFCCYCCSCSSFTFWCASIHPVQRSPWSTSNFSTSSILTIWRFKIERWSFEIEDLWR